MRIWLEARSRVGDNDDGHLPLLSDPAPIYLCLRDIRRDITHITFRSRLLGIKYVYWMDMSYKVTVVTTQ